MKDEENRKSDEAVDAQNSEIAPAAEAASDEFLSSELNDPRWSVVSFEKCEATGLTYDEAARNLQELASNGVFGLCITTNEAAEKVVQQAKSKRAKT